MIMVVDSAFWFLLIGSLLLALGLTAPIFKRVPATSAMIYLMVGIVIGPTGLAIFHFNPLKQSAILETCTEIAVLISLFAAGIKMPVPFRISSWCGPIKLACLSMVFSVGSVTLFGYYLLHLPLGAAVLLGAIVAPTDPVLATDVQVRHPGDSDDLRFSLTSEAGMNDGTAFPFVMLGLGLLGLHDLGDYGARWLVVDVFWATFAGIALGTVCGYVLAVVAANLRRKFGPTSALLDDFLGLGLIGAVYGASLMVNAWGFLAVFVAAVSLRQTELGLASAVPEEPQVQKKTFWIGTEQSERHVSEGTLIFKEHLERLSELLLILLIGGTLFIDSWSWRAVGFAAFLFFVARPLSVMFGLFGSTVTPRVKFLAGWFGVRGIGSLYYLMYAIEHGLSERTALELIHIVLVVVTLSIFIHGFSVKPVMRRFSYSSRQDLPRWNLAQQT